MEDDEIWEVGEDECDDEEARKDLEQLLFRETYTTKLDQCSKNRSAVFVCCDLTRAYYETFRLLRMGGLLSDVMKRINERDIIFASQRQASEGSTKNPLCPR